MASFVVVLILLRVVVALHPTPKFSTICAQMLTLTLSMMQLSLFTCPSGIDYKVVFCPWSLNHLYFSFSLFYSFFRPFFGGVEVVGLSYSFFQLYRQLFISAPLASRNMVPLSQKYRSLFYLNISSLFVLFFFNV